jgi:hypothetical protein
MKKKERSQLGIIHHEMSLHHDMSFRDRSADTPHCHLSGKESKDMSSTDTAVRKIK